MKTGKSKKKTLILLLLITIFTGVAAIVVGMQLLQDDSLIPDKADAGAPSDAIETSYTCSGGCESGSECNGNEDPMENYMWACYKNPQGTYKCFNEPIKYATDSQCYLDCPYTWRPCDCDVNACETLCKKNNAGQIGDFTQLYNCDGCKQDFVCGCELTEVPTPTSTPRPTSTSKPTSTPVATNTPRPSNTPVATNTPGPSSTPIITNTPANTPVLTNTPTNTPVVTNTPISTPTSTPTNTPVITNTPTLTPTGIINTPTITPTGEIINTPIGTVTITPTGDLPTTALISDEVDRLLIGVFMIFTGWTIYWFGLYKDFDQKLAKFYGTKFGMNVKEIIEGESKEKYSRKMRKKINKKE